jgi:Carboxypeptidase regulatory-like domain/TonB dependent receptor
MRWKQFAVTVAVASIVAAWAAPAAAQATVNAASVSGRVFDAQGAVVPGALVVARQSETNVSTETTTDAAGRFRFALLRVGPYEITARLQGFNDATERVTLGAASAFDLALTLTVARLNTSVEVTAAPAVLETARTQIAGTVPRAEINRLPLNGRNLLDVALVVPGVSPTNVASTQLFAETSAVAGPGLSINSQRNFSNSFIVDGLSANDDAAGLSGMPYSVDAVDQFQVVTSGGQAEFGRALGGYINVVTRSGTNEAHGDVYEYVRNDAWNAANPLSGSTLPMDQHQFGASVGGPLVRNRTFYFGNFEGRRLDQSGLVTILPASVAAINEKLAASGYPGQPVATGLFPNPVRSENAIAKVDHQFSGADQISVRYSQYHVSSENSRGAGGLSAPTASAHLENVDRSIATSNTFNWSGHTLNETRAQVTFSDLQAPPSDPIGPAVGVSGIAAFGTLSGSPTRRLNALYELVDNVSHQAGGHALRAGVSLLYNDSTITYPRSIRGAYSFASLANFLGGVYNNGGYTQTFGATEVSQINPNVGVYAQDEWQAGGGLTLNLGLRYDLQFLQTIRTDTDNVSPRAGFAWTPAASHRTVLRGSAGVFYDRVPLRALANALLSANNTTDLSQLRQISVNLSPSQAGAPAFPAILSAPIPSVTLANLTTMDRGMQNGQSRQAGFEIEQQVGERATVSVGYQHLTGRNLIISINQNVPACVANGNNNGCRPNPAYGNNSQYSPAARSTYNGLTLSFVQRPAGWSSYRVSYTLSKSMDDVGQFFFSSPIDPFDPMKDWGRSDDDQRHRLVINGAVNSPMGTARTLTERLTHGFQLSALLRYYSALPLNITSGLTTVQGTAGRPIVNEFIERNSGTGPDFFSLDLRASRTFRITPRLAFEAFVEAFNLTNHINVVTVNGNFGPGAYPANPSPTFGQITAVGEPRSLQLAVRARF